MKIASTALVLALLCAGTIAGAARDIPKTPATPIVEEAATMSEGEIRKIDKDAMKITLKHGEIKSLDMPAMTMVFQVRDAALLERGKVGDRVNFRAEKVGGAIVLTAIEPVSK